MHLQKNLSNSVARRASFWTGHRQEGIARIVRTIRSYCWAGEIFFKHEIEKERLNRLRSRRSKFNLFHLQQCYKAEVASEYVDKCRGYQYDCQEFFVSWIPPIINFPQASKIYVESTRKWRIYLSIFFRLKPIPLELSPIPSHPEWDWRIIHGESMEFHTIPSMRKEESEEEAMEKYERLIFNFCSTCLVMFHQLRITHG